MKVSWGESSRVSREQRSFPNIVQIAVKFDYAFQTESGTPMWRSTIPERTYVVFYRFQRDSASYCSFA